MAFDYAAMRDETVIPLITEFGKSGSMLVSEPPTPSGGALVDRDGNTILDRDGNPITVRGVVAIAPYESQLGYDVLYPITLMQIGFKKADNNGTLVEVGDVLFLVSTQGVTIDPDLADRIKVDDVIYQVVRIDPLKPGPIIMFWKIHARK